MIGKYTAGYRLTERRKIIDHINVLPTDLTTGTTTSPLRVAPSSNAASASGLLLLGVCAYRTSRGRVRHGAGVAVNIRCDAAQYEIGHS